ncbi:carboxylesterase [Azorhizobium oxalatiphilum]|uniref:Carboxylesterase n=1 Tax=Azorhizobium oxalatiphilum TaxID=980631 RepID=A0A917FDY4_9HYPH|nr:alpha/beta hydrolase [Azorhizobium oxalatiphilum]GGF70137.1 carboxylesterase [Azorhizobium oxalatiphilum]
MLRTLLSPAGLLNALAAVQGGFSVTRDLAYGPHARHRLDVFRPRQPRAPAPVLVFFYGGGWEEGDRAAYLFVGAALARLGFVVAIPDYRVFPDARFPAFLEDAAHAVRWVHAHAGQMGGNGAGLLLIGHSAGAHIAAMLTFDPQWLGGVGLEPDHVLTAMVGLAGPYDFLPLHSARLKQIFAPAPGLEATQPITFAHGHGPPVMLATGRADRVVDPGNSLRLADRIRRLGGVADVRFYDRVNHATLLGAFAAPLRPLAPVLLDTVAFLHRASAAASGCASSAGQSFHPEQVCEP